jgi:ribosomal protein S18 acetylase RimI-like enzyme
MATGPRYKVAFRRRRENRTDYYARRRLLTSQEPRAIVRRSNKNVSIQFADFGMEGDSIEMLFVHADFRGRGIGSTLMREALLLGASRVDVNEQNPQALGFYRCFGFEVAARDELDSLGLPYPILHCTLKK